MRGEAREKGRREKEKVSKPMDRKTWAEIWKRMKLIQGAELVVVMTVIFRAVVHGWWNVVAVAMFPLIATISFVVLEISRKRRMKKKGLRRKKKVRIEFSLMEQVDIVEMFVITLIMLWAVLRDHELVLITLAIPLGIKLIGLLVEIPRKAKKNMPPRENGRVFGFESRRGQSEVKNKMENSGKNVGMVAGSGEPVARMRNALEGEIRGIRVRIFPPMEVNGLATIQVGDGLDLVDCCRCTKSVLVWKTAELLRAYLNQEGVC